MNAPAMGGISGSGPVQEHERIDAIDVVRGFALFGIVLVNIGFFAHPVSEPFFLAADASALDRAVHAFVAVFVAGKFYPLFSMMFGLGFAIQLERARLRGEEVERLYVRRLFVLLVIGLLHGIFLWAGDVLVAYAFLGFLLIFFMHAPPRALLTSALVAYSLQLLLLAGFTLALLAKPGDTEALLTGMTAGMNEAANLRAQAWSTYANGSWSEVTSVRMREFAVALQNMVFFAMQVFGMLLLGAWFGRRGVLVNVKRHAPILKGLLLAALFIGLPASAAYAKLSAHIDYLGEPTPMIGYALILNLVAGVLLALGYIAALTLAMGTRAAQGLRVFAPVGRMALTNYLLQSVIFTTIFYPHGLGWFGELSASQLVVVGVLVFIAQLLFSHWWMSKYRFGPAEWLWRSMTYLKWQPLRRQRDPLTRMQGLERRG